MREDASRQAIPPHLLSKGVQYMVVALRLHFAVASVCSAAMVALARLADFWEAPVCVDVIQLDGVVAIVKCMGAHISQDKIQKFGLKLLSSLTRRYPQQTLGEANIRAIITAMLKRPHDRLTQLFGCAALRSLSEQNAAAAEDVG